jgi:26S proteasome regulatory subunit N9
LPDFCHAAHYEAAMTYYKLVGPPEAFYEQAMSFLNYAPPTATTNYQQLAVDLCLAALTGDGVYNLHLPKDLLPIAPKWLTDMVTAVANGEVLEFRKLTQDHAEEIKQQPALVHRATAVQEKITMLALVHLVFDKPSMERTLSLEEIAQHLQVPIEQVEWVIMRALSVKLIEGTIDQVDQTLQVTWVMPRVLTKKQMSDLAVRYGEWADKVTTAKDYMHEQTPSFG